MKLDKAIEKRRSIRKFKSKKPNWRDILECIDTTRYSPMAGGNFSLKFILVSDKEKIEKLSDAAQQEFIKEAQYVLVVCSNPSRTKNAYGERAERYCRQQAGAAIQNFLLSITEKGLATCWIGHFVDEQVKVPLRIPKDVYVEAIFPIGYELEKPVTRKIKSDLDNELYFDTYKNMQMKSPKKIEARKVGKSKEN